MDAQRSGSTWRTSGVRYSNLNLQMNTSSIHINNCGPADTIFELLPIFSSCCMSSSSVMSTDPVEPPTKDSPQRVIDTQRFTFHPIPRLNLVPGPDVFKLIVTGSKAYGFLFDMNTFRRHSTYFRSGKQYCSGRLLDSSQMRVVDMGYEHADHWGPLIEAIYDPMYVHL